LLRNDLSRIAEPFSVRVPRLFHTEALPAVWQMTSDVEARTRAGCSLADVFAALFPCGSITGAPKVRAMQAIRALEPDPRGVYCGAIGIVRPGGTATFNVPIRTVTLRGNAARCGIGSGITSSATADGEWREWSLKQAFVQRASAPFELLETLALADGQLRDADAHLARMSQAAQHFGYPWDARHVEGVLQSVVDAHAQDAWRIRLLLDAARACARRSLCAAGFTGARAPATGAARAGRGPWRIRAQQDHPACSLRRVHAHRPRGIRHAALERRR
jgi:para-aminobenzoate synthetase/4-amino-4-deoxychorismate lyase